jgi:serine/threonine protein kinase
LQGVYKLVKEIARGRMGQIYFGKDPELKRHVAIKVSSLAEGGMDPRFTKEAKVLAQLAHPNMVLMRPSPTVEALVCSPPFEADVAQIIRANDREAGDHDPMLELARDPAFRPYFDLSGMPEGACYKPSRFSARILSEIKAVDAPVQ